MNRPASAATAGQMRWLGATADVGGVLVVVLLLLLVDVLVQRIFVKTPALPQTVEYQYDTIAFSSIVADQIPNTERTSNTHNVRLHVARVAMACDTCCLGGRVRNGQPKPMFETITIYATLAAVVGLSLWLLRRRHRRPRRWSPSYHKCA